MFRWKLSDKEHLNYPKDSSWLLQRKIKTKLSFKFAASSRPLLSWPWDWAPKFVVIRSFNLISVRVPPINLICSHYCWPESMSLLRWFRYNVDIFWRNISSAKLHTAWRRWPLFNCSSPIPPGKESEWRKIIGVTALETIYQWNDSAGTGTTLHLNPLSLEFASDKKNTRDLIKIIFFIW